MLMEQHLLQLGLEGLKWLVVVSLMEVQAPVSME